MRYRNPQSGNSWLGVIDEIFGETTLPNMRTFVEGAKKDALPAHQ
jgi:hypothetical protein